MANTSGLLAAYTQALADRQRRLENPNKITSFFNELTGGGQRPVEDMKRDAIAYYLSKNAPPYEIDAGDETSIGNYSVEDPRDTRKTAGIPLGIGAVIGRMLPNSYYKMTPAEQIFVQSQKGYEGDTVFGRNLGGQDVWGTNITSGWGNYPEKIAKDVHKLNAHVRNSQARYIDQWGSLDSINQYGKTWAQMNEMNLAKLQNRTSQLEELNKIKEEIGDPGFLREEQIKKEQDAADIAFGNEKLGIKGSGDHDEYSGIGEVDYKVPTSIYKYEGSDEEDEANALADYQNQQKEKIIKANLIQDTDDAGMGVDGSTLRINSMLKEAMEGTDDTIDLVNKTLQKVDDRHTSEEFEDMHGGGSGGYTGAGTSGSYAAGPMSGGYGPWSKADGGRVGLKDGGTWSPGVGRTAEGYIDRPTEIETDTTETVDIEPSLVYGQDTRFDVKDFEGQGFGVPFDLNPTTLARIQGNIYPTEEDLINIDGSLGVGNDKYNLTTDFTDEGVIGTNVNLNNFYANIDPYKNVSDLGYANNIGDWNYDINYQPENKNLMLQIAKDFRKGGRVYLNLGGLASIL